MIFEYKIENVAIVPSETGGQLHGLCVKEYKVCTTNQTNLLHIIKRENFLDQDIDAESFTSAIDWLDTEPVSRKRPRTYYEIQPM